MIFSGHKAAVNSVAISKNKTFIASGSTDKTVKIWDILKIKEECTFNGQIDKVTSVTISQDENFVISGSEDKTVKVWSLQVSR